MILTIFFVSVAVNKPWNYVKFYLLLFFKNVNLKLSFFAQQSFSVVAVVVDVASAMCILLIKIMTFFLHHQFFFVSG